MDPNMTNPAVLLARVVWIADQNRGLNQTCAALLPEAPQALRSAVIEGLREQSTDLVGTPGNEYGRVRAGNLAENEDLYWWDNGGDTDWSSDQPDGWDLPA